MAVASVSQNVVEEHVCYDANETTYFTLPDQFAQRDQSCLSRCRGRASNQRSKANIQFDNLIELMSIDEEKLKTACNEYPDSGKIVQMKSVA